MAKYVLTYTPDGKEKKELTYKGELFSYTMIPDEHGKTGDNKGFDIQVAARFPNEPEEVMTALEEIGFGDEDDILEALEVLDSHEEDSDDDGPGIDLEKIERQFEEYCKEFNTSEYMDIDTHTSMAMQVGHLLKDVKRRVMSSYQAGYKQGKFDAEMENTFGDE